MNLPTITDIKIKNSSGNKNSNTILVSTRKFDPNTHRIILRVNKKFYDDLKYHIKEVVIDEGRSQFQLPGMNESVTIFAQLYDYKNDRIICTKRKDFTKILGSWGLALGDSIMSTQNDYFNLFWNSNRKVVKVNGPFDKDGKLQAEVKPGERYYFTAEPNQKLHSVELLSAKWAYQYDDGNPVLFKNHNETIKNGYSAMDCEFHADPRKIKVFAYFQQRNENVMVEFANFGKTEDIEEEIQEAQKTEENPLENVEEKTNEGIKKESKVCIEEARVRAFMRMLRVGEGTEHESGYTRLFGGQNFTKAPHNKNISKHPEINIYWYTNKDGEKIYSSAAGAYQIMKYTYWWLNGEELNKYNKKTGKYNEKHDYIKKYKISDFSPESQDKICIILLRHKQSKRFLDLIINNMPKEAMQKYGSYEWASLPPGQYGQPTQTMKEALAGYEKYLKEELKGMSNLHLKNGFLKDFGYTDFTYTNEAKESGLEQNVNKLKNSKAPKVTEKHSKVKINFGENAKKDAISMKTLNILKDIGEKSGNYSIYISSTARDPYNQARIMYDNCKKDLKGQYRIYKAPGDKVIDVYVLGTKKRLQKDKIIRNMEHKINELGPTTVSKHIADPKSLNTFDIPINSLSNGTFFYNLIKSHKAVELVLLENGCYHIQIPQ